MSESSEKRKVVAVCSECGEQHLVTIRGLPRSVPPSKCKKCREKGKYMKDEKGKLRRVRI